MGRICLHALCHPLPEVEDVPAASDGDAQTESGLALEADGRIRRIGNAARDLRQVAERYEVTVHGDRQFPQHRYSINPGAGADEDSIMSRVDEATIDYVVLAPDDIEDLLRRDSESPSLR